MYHVWMRSPDGYAGVSEHDPSKHSNHGWHAETGLRFTFTTLSNHEEWADALHALLDARGLTAWDSHLQRSCTRCWEDRRAGRIASVLYAGL